MPFHFTTEDGKYFFPTERQDSTVALYEEIMLRDDAMESLVDLIQKNTKSCDTVTLSCRR